MAPRAAGTPGHQPGETDMLSPGTLVNAVFVVGGLVWCKEVVARFRIDLAEFRDSADGSRRLAIGAIWMLTLAIAAWLLRQVSSWVGIGG